MCVCEGMGGGNPPRSVGEDGGASNPGQDGSWRWSGRRHPLTSGPHNTPHHLRRSPRITAPPGSSSSSWAVVRLSFATVSAIVLSFFITVFTHDLCNLINEQEQSIEKNLVSSFIMSPHLQLCSTA